VSEEKYNKFLPINIGLNYCSDYFFIYY